MRIRRIAIIELLDLFAIQTDRLKFLACSHRGLPMVLQALVRSRPTKLVREQTYGKACKLHRDNHVFGRHTSLGTISIQNEYRSISRRLCVPWFVTHADGTPSQFLQQ